MSGANNGPHLPLAGTPWIVRLVRAAVKKVRAAVEFGRASARMA
jgi:hypothetical protein